MITNENINTAEDNDPAVFTLYTGGDECFEMPAEVTSVAEGAFAKNKTLRHADLRNVRYIGDSAFAECTALESVVISNAAVIGAHAFEFCSSLNSVTFGEVREIGDEAFFGCGELDIPEIPRSLTDLGAAAFSHIAIRRADLHWLDRIPASLFRGCTSLTYADISGASEIGDDAFADCWSLSYIRFGDAVKIGDRAFARCESYEPAELPRTLQYIGDNAFCKVRKGLIVPKSVRRIGRNCFGPIDTSKAVSIYRSALYEFRNYFRFERSSAEEDLDEHFHLWESAIDVTVLDNETDEVVGFLPVFSDLYDPMRDALTGAFREDDTFDYAALDTEFFDGMRWNQRCRDKLAVMRLKHPFGLTEEARAHHLGYLSKDSKRIAKRAIKDNDVGILTFLYDNELIGRDSVNEMLDYSISLSASECTAFLLERQAEYDRRRAPLIDEL